MAIEAVVGAVLVAGLALFLVGAGAYRPAAYDVPLAEALPAIHRDRRRWRWIHVWMIIAMLVTPAGLAGMAAVVTESAGRVAVVMATVVYGIGAVCWIASLTFRVTVVAWAADEAATSGATPDVVPALDRWATSLYTVHMCSAYVASSTLGLALVTAGTPPRWLGWAGVVWGLVFLAGFVTPRVSAFFHPPAWAHVYTGAVGISLLVN